MLGMRSNMQWESDTNSPEMQNAGRSQVARPIGRRSSGRWPSRGHTALATVNVAAGVAIVAWDSLKTVWAPVSTQPNPLRTNDGARCRAHRT